MRTTDERRDRGTRASRSTGSRVTDACFDSSLGDAVGTALACFPLKAVSVLASRPVACAAGRTHTRPTRPTTRLCLSLSQRGEAARPRHQSRGPAATGRMWGTGTPLHVCGWPDCLSSPGVCSVQGRDHRRKHQHSDCRSDSSGGRTGNRSSKHAAAFPQKNTGKVRLLSSLSLSVSQCDWL